MASSRSPVDFFRSLRANTFLRNASVLSSGSALGHVFTLAAGPLLTRLYGPGEFGALGLFTSFISIVGVAITLQYEISIPVAGSEAEAAYLTFGSLALAVPMSLLAGILLWALIRTNSLGFGALPHAAPLLLGLTLASIGFFAALRYWSLRESQFRTIAQGTLVQSAARAVLQAGLGFAGLHSLGLLLGESLGRSVGMSKMLRSAWPALRRTGSQFQWSAMREALWRHRKFPMYSFPSSFLDAVFLALPLPLLIRMFGVSTGGYYSVVWKAITVPSVLITVAVADTFHGQLAECVRNTPEKAGGLFKSLSLGLLFAGLLPAMLLRFFGPPMFSWIFGARWALSGVMAAIIAPWYLAQFVVSPLSRVVVVLSGQELKLVWDVLCIASLFGVFGYAHWKALDALQTVRLLSWVYAGLFVAYYLILVRIIVRFNHDVQAKAAMEAN
jgi:O-antigen/teichoic acid export membrane protein